MNKHHKENFSGRAHHCSDPCSEQTTTQRFVGTNVTEGAAISEARDRYCPACGALIINDQVYTNCVGKAMGHMVVDYITYKKNLFSE